MDIKYSFVVPAFNNQENLGRSIIAMLRQACHFNYEIVIVDDGSDQVLEKQLQHLADLDIVKFVRIERTSRSSRSAARNTGWRLARGKYIVFVDSDILVKPNHLTELERYFSVESEAIVVGTRIHVNEVQKHSLMESGMQVKIEVDYAMHDYRAVAFSAESFNGRTINNMWLHAYTCNLALSRECLQAVGGFDENILKWGIEDLELAYRLSKAQFPILINPKLEVFHQLETRRDDLAISLERLVGYEKNVQYFLVKHPDALSGYESPKALLIDGKFYEEVSSEIKQFNFRCGDSLINLKTEVDEYLSRHSGFVVLNDFDEDQDLDIWCQLESEHKNNILYFPVSKKINVDSMMQFIYNKRMERDSSYSETHVAL